MSTAFEEATRGEPSAPSACEVIADMEGTEETGALSDDEHQWHSNGSIVKEESIGRSVMSSIPISSTSSSRNSSSSRRPSVAPFVSVLISLASLSLMISAISLALTCVAVTTSARQRRVGVATEELQALYKAQTNNDSSETIRNEARVPGSAYRTQKKDTKTSVHRPLSSSSSRRLSEPNAASAAAHSVPCQCTEISHVTLEAPVAAHASGAETDADMNSGITTWLNKVGVSDQIQCRDGRLVALEGGVYAVYSQLYIILYPEEGEERGEVGADSFWHGVFRRHSSDEKSVGRGEKAEEELMKRVWTVAWRRDDGEVSSYLAGVFHLSSNDELTVRWSKSKKSEIHPDQKMTYFGMFKIR